MDPTAIPLACSPLRVTFSSSDAIPLSPSSDSETARFLISGLNLACELTPQPFGYRLSCWSIGYNPLALHPWTGTAIDPTMQALAAETRWAAVDDPDATVDISHEKMLDRYHRYGRSTRRAFADTTREIDPDTILRQEVDTAALIARTRIDHKPLHDKIPGLMIRKSGYGSPFTVAGSWHHYQVHFSYQHGQARLEVGEQLDSFGDGIWHAQITTSADYPDILSLEQFHELFLRLATLLERQPPRYEFPILDPEVFRAVPTRARMIGFGWDAHTARADALARYAKLRARLADPADPHPWATDQQAHQATGHHPITIEQRPSPEEAATVFAILAHSPHTGTS